MHIYSIITVVFSVFIFITILYCYFHTFKIERYMQSRMNKSTALDIYNMSYMEREIGLGKNNSSGASKKNHLSVLIKFDYKMYSGQIKQKNISISRINQNNSEWEEIIQNNIQQALNSGFIKNLDSYVCNDDTYEYKYIGNPKHSKILKCDEQSISFYYIFFGCNDLENDRGSSIMPLIDSYKYYRNAILS